MEVFLSELAESKLKELTDHLLKNWNYKVKMDFLSKLSNRINQISIQPESCPKSKEFGGFFKCVVTKQTTFFYRIHSQKHEIEIITLIDTRQNPEKIRRRLKK